MKPTLFLLAAGMGSRYGGLKQLDGLGPNGETSWTILSMMPSVPVSAKSSLSSAKTLKNNSAHKSFQNTKERFRLSWYSKVWKHCRSFTCPEGRVKPWGTNHAVLMGKDVIKEPFCVINCDDFYGRDAFATIGKFLSELPEGSQNTYAMVGFRCCNTLSENGSVARGVCMYDDHHHLKDVVERTEIMRVDGPICYKDEEGKWIPLEENVPVSMNMWGFTPDYFQHSEEYFKEFLSNPKNMENPKAEFFIPLMVNKLINEGTATVEVLDTTSKWFGVTYAADREATVEKIASLVAAGEYPEKLF